MKNKNVAKTIHHSESEFSPNYSMSIILNPTLQCLILVMNKILVMNITASRISRASQTAKVYKFYESGIIGIELKKFLPIVVETFILSE